MTRNATTALALAVTVAVSTLSASWVVKGWNTYLHDSDQSQFETAK